MRLKARLLSLTIVASQVRHYVKPQDSSFMDLLTTVATTVLSLGHKAIAQRKPKAE